MSHPSQSHHCYRCAHHGKLTYTLLPVTWRIVWISGVRTEVAYGWLCETCTDYAYMSTGVRG